MHATLEECGLCETLWPARAQCSHLPCPFSRRETAAARLHACFSKGCFSTTPSTPHTAASVGQQGTHTNTHTRVKTHGHTYTHSHKHTCTHTNTRAHTHTHMHAFANFSALLATLPHLSRENCPAMCAYLQWVYGKSRLKQSGMHARRRQQCVSLHG